MNKSGHAFVFLLFHALVFSVNATTLYVNKSGQYPTIQSAINAVHRFDTIIVPAGYYKETGISVTKPLLISGKGLVVIDGMDKGTIITVTSDLVTINGLTLQNTGSSTVEDWAAIKLLKSNYCFVSNNIIINACFGIFLANSSNITMYHNRLTGSAVDEVTSGGGLHLLHCNHCHLIGNKIEKHRDGIYFEFVTYSAIEFNVSENNIRYGLHFMFSDHDTYLNNTFKKNLAGVAVMYSNFIVMRYNSFEDNWGSASYGLFLRTIKNGEIKYNLFDGNTVGIEMEGTDASKVHFNNFKNNGWALRIVSDCFDDTVASNNFVNNSFDVATYGTGHCAFTGNYWDNYQGYDLDHNGIGDIPFQPVTLYSMITQVAPESMILLNSFMVNILNKAESLVPVYTPVAEKDNTPLMQPLTINSYGP